MRLQGGGVVKESPFVEDSIKESSTLTTLSDSFVAGSPILEDDIHIAALGDVQKEEEMPPEDGFEVGRDGSSPVVSMRPILGPCRFRIVLCRCWYFQIGKSTPS